MAPAEHGRRGKLLEWNACKYVATVLTIEHQWSLDTGAMWEWICCHDGYRVTSSDWSYTYCRDKLLVISRFGRIPPIPSTTYSTPLTRRFIMDSMSSKTNQLPCFNARRDLLCPIRWMSNRVFIINFTSYYSYEDQYLKNSWQLGFNLPRPDYKFSSKAPL
jgi:hypothetical protein